MPRKKCSVCTHTDCSSINAALAGVASIREIAQRFAVSKSALERHVQHSGARKTSSVSDDEIRRIDTEIRKLHVSETAARRRGEAALALRIAREIRSWHDMRVKAVGLFEANGQTATKEISPAEALELAKGVIESQLTNPAVKTWVRELNERMNGADDSVSVGQRNSGSDVSETNEDS